MPLRVDIVLGVVLLGVIIWYFYKPGVPENKGLQCARAEVECCSHPSDFIPNVENLRKAFDQHLFGQHLAHEIILGAVHGHVTNPNPGKPLVLSLHGPAGTGKNHITRLMVQSLRPKGMKSKFVTVKMSTTDYPHKHLLEQYKEELVSLLKSKVSRCAYHIFVFDEAENMPAGLLDSIKDYLDHHDTVDGINFRKAIFIFRSNLASPVISQHVQDLLEKGVPRKTINSVEMEKIIRNYILHDPNAGFYNAKIINSHLVSYFVPFLPLEKFHVRQCIQAEIWARVWHPDLEVEIAVLEQLEFGGPRGSEIFAVKGCKNVAEKVGVMLYQRRHRNQ